MNQPNDLKNRAPDESLCSLLVGFNFLFFTGLLAFLLILPLKAVFTGSDAGHDDAGAGHAAVDAEVHTAAGEAEPIESASAGKTAYAICATCHGAEGQGNAAMHAPALAGQETWYLKRQINKFKDGARGTHADDLYGMQMRPMAMTLQSDEQIDAVAEYIASLPAAHPVATLDGDAAKGAGAYMLCQACHGANAEGNVALNAPALQSLPDWYIVSQLKNYKAGVRGADPKDIEGMQMRPMAMTVADEAAMKDLAAFINSKAAAK
jgi:cytochrome c oxidase subunit 2